MKNIIGTIALSVVLVLCASCSKSDPLPDVELSGTVWTCAKDGGNVTKVIDFMDATRCVRTTTSGGESKKEYGEWFYKVPSITINLASHEVVSATVASDGKSFTDWYGDIYYLDIKQ